MTGNLENANMPPTKLPPLTLIVATTPITTAASHGILKLGIGKGGTLPWPRIKTDMSFFARVTTRSPTTSSSATVTPAINAVIMGRKTYDSIPTRFRPLPKRLNVIITRDESGSVKERAIAEWYASNKRETEEKAGQASVESNDTSMTEKPAIMVSNSLEAALHSLQEGLSSGSSSHGDKRNQRLGNIFIIGGSEIYESSLRLNSSVLGDKNPLRIVMSDVRRGSGLDSQCEAEDLVDGFDCDTTFPIDPKVLKESWRQVSSQELGEWVGEEISPDWTWEGDIAVKMVGYERL